MKTLSLIALFSACFIATTNAASPADIDIPLLRLDHSEIVGKAPDGNYAVATKDGKPVDGVKLSVNDIQITSPDIAVGRDGTIHAIFVEQLGGQVAWSLYYRSSSDDGKTWSDPKNLTDDEPQWISVGYSRLKIDAAGRVYAIWKRDYSAPLLGTGAIGGGGTGGNLVYRVLQNGQWSKILPVQPTGQPAKMNGVYSWFVTLDAQVAVNVIWNTFPDQQHPDLMYGAAPYKQHGPNINAGDILRTKLDGPNASAPDELYMPKATLQNAWSKFCEGYDAMSGYLDPQGQLCFDAIVMDPHDAEHSHDNTIVFFNGKVQTPIWQFVGAEAQFWNNPPQVILDAAQKPHVIFSYLAGEHPALRDYTVGSDAEPVIIRQTPVPKAYLRDFTVVQGPAGRAIALVSMNDTGDPNDFELYMSLFDGQQWGDPVNVTNNALRASYQGNANAIQSAGTITSHLPGPAAAAFDRDGHVLLLMVNNEHSVFGVTALGVETAGGSTTTPRLYFIKI